MHQTLQPYIPERSLDMCIQLIKQYGVHLKIVRSRVSRHGDYRRLEDGSHQITVNASENKYRFLITLVHEIAHLVAFEKYGYRIKPHGPEWKLTFKMLMAPFIRPEIFPMNLLPVLARHFKNPKASSSTDTALALALKEFDADSDKQYVYQIPLGGVFRLYNGKTFTRGNKRVKRYECLELDSGKTYLFQPHAEVELIRE